MSDRNRVLDKIQKLLTLAARAATPGETDAAMAAVQRLMLKHRLSQAEIEEAGSRPEGFVEEEAFAAERVPYELCQVCNVLRDYFFVRLLQGRSESGRRRMFLFGRPADVAVGKYVGTFLLRTFRACWRNHKRRECLRSDRAARPYYAGLALGLSQRLAAERNRLSTGEAGIILRADGELQAVFDARYRAAKPARQRQVTINTETARHARAGLQDGKEIQIRIGLKGAGDSPELPHERRQLALPAPR